MIQEIKMWGANCDICNTQYDLYDGCIALNDKGAVIDSLSDDNEWVITEENKTYCPDCHFTFWNEETDKNEVFSSGETRVFLGIEK